MGHLDNLGLIISFIGAFILGIVSISKMPYTRNYQERGKKRYWLPYEWKIVFTFPPKLKQKSRFAFIPPKIMWTLVGILFIIFGVLFQLIGNLI